MKSGAVTVTDSQTTLYDNTSGSFVVIHIQNNGSNDIELIAAGQSFGSGPHVSQNTWRTLNMPPGGLLYAIAASGNSADVRYLVED